MTAAAHVPSAQHIRAYDRAYHAAARRFGRRAPGRNIAKDGLAHGRLTDRIVVRSLGVLRRMLTPPASTPTVAATQVIPQPVTSTAPASSLPTCTWLPESGGNWQAVNPSSGAGGRYQIMPSTWAANGGTGSPQSASPAEQTAVAQRVWRSQGPSAWVNC